MMHMQHWLDKRASLTPNRTALVDKEGQLSFAELRSGARALAERLAGLGIGEGSFVALLCNNGRHVLELIHAIHYLKAVLLPLNTKLTPRELVVQLNDAGASHVIHDESYAGTAEQIGEQLSDIVCMSVSGLPKVVPLAAKLAAEIDMDALNTVMYTSGTTGVPKGVKLTYNNHFASAIGSVLNLGLSEHDRWLVSVPLFHISGLSVVMRSVIYGMPIVLHEKFDPERMNAAIMEQGVTVVSVVSHMLGRMIDALGDSVYPDAFRGMLLGGGPAPLPLLERCAAKGIPVFQTYGMTETASQIVTLQPEYMLSKLGSAGKPLFQAELKIMEDGKEMPPHVPGEIVVRGPNVTAGYLNRPEATAESVRQGWLHTGDVGYVDEEGFLYVLDRRKDMFISGGENIYPAEIESVLAGHPAVLEAGVTGMDDEKWGKSPAAFICLRPGFALTGQDVTAYCADKLAKYKRPTRVFFVDKLPRNASNKLLRRELLQLVPQPDGSL